MSNAKITLFGFDAYFSSLGQSLFDNLTLPEGLTKDTLVDNILLRGGEFEVMYGDPEFTRRAIGAWSLKWAPTFKRWVDALAIDYNPLENYDRIEDWTDNTERSDATTHEGILGRTQSSAHSESGVDSETSSESGTYSQSDARHIDSDTGVTTERNSDNPPTHVTMVSAYDSADYQNKTKEVDTGKWKETTSGDSNESSASSSESSSTGNTGRSTSSQSSGADETSENTRDNSSSAMTNDAVHSGRVHGNIGVTTSQQMLMAELELGYWNIYEKVTELFLQEFTIPVYI